MKNLLVKTRQIILVTMFAAGSAFLLNVTAFAQGKLWVRIAAETTVQFDQIRLGEIATVTGADSEATDRIKGISLGFSPRAGMMREISRPNILLAMAAAGFEKSVALEMADKVLIRRAAQTVEQGLLREAVEKAILPQFVSENITAKITKLELPEKVELPTGNVEIRVINFQGIVHFDEPTIISLEIRIDEKVLRRISANVTVEAFADVLALNRDLASGTRLVESDVQTKNVRLEKALSSYLRTPADLAGKKLLKNLSASSLLTTDTVTADTVIKAGDTVSIVARSGSMQIAVTGEARASGRIGDRIAVKNTQSGVILQAMVIDQGTVKLNF